MPFCSSAERHFYFQETLRTVPRIVNENELGAKDKFSKIVIAYNSGQIDEDNRK